MSGLLADPNWVSALSGAVTALAALVALLFGIYQVQSSKWQQQESTAYSLYSEQLRLDIERPDLAVPDYEFLEDKKLTAEYSAYLSHLIFICEAILKISRNKIWRKNIIYYLAFHADWIKSKNFELGKDYFEGEIVNLLRQAVENRDTLIESYLRRDGAYIAPEPIRPSKLVIAGH